MFVLAWSCNFVSWVDACLSVCKVRSIFSRIHKWHLLVTWLKDLVNIFNLFHNLSFDLPSSICVWIVQWRFLGVRFWNFIHGFAKCLLMMLLITLYKCLPCHPPSWFLLDKCFPFNILSTFAFICGCSCLSNCVQISIYVHKIFRVKYSEHLYGILILLLFYCWSGGKTLKVSLKLLNYV